MEEENNQVPQHHKRQDICATRKRYRDGRRDTAIKVYTISQESRYLMITGVPAVGASEELIKLCSLYGQVDAYHIMDEYPGVDAYTEVYLVKFNKLPSSRAAKRKLDDYSFFGGILHVFYCPEYENLEETRQKLTGRRRWVAGQLKALQVSDQQPSSKGVVCPKPYIDVIEPTQTLSNQRRQIGHMTKPIVTSSANKQRSNNGQGQSSNIGESVPHPPYHDDPFTYDLMSYPSNQFMGAAHSHTEQPSNITRAVDNDGGNYVPFAVREIPYGVHSVPKSQNTSRNNCQHSTVLNDVRKCGKTEDYKGEVSNLDEGKLIHGVKIKSFTGKSMPKFVPRQVAKNMPSSSASEEKSKREQDELDDIIKRNAYVLGPIAGPRPLPGAVCHGLSKEDVFIENTRAAIREKIKQFCPTLLPRQLRKRKRTETLARPDVTS